jgi:nucleoside-diphosphate-sugar epimerase
LSATRQVIIVRPGSDPDHLQPHFAFNTVLPDYVAGPAANPTPGNYSTHTFLNQVFQGDANSYAVAFMKPASRFVDVRDTADVHLAALTESHLDGQRLWAAPHKFTIDDILAAWREAFPDRKILPDFKFEGQPDINIDDEQSTALLKAFKGADWYSLKETVVDNVKSVL